MSIDNLLDRKDYLEGHIQELRHYNCDNELQIIINQNNLMDVIQELKRAGVVLGGL